jgi:hypothetical protein
MTPQYFGQQGNTVNFTIDSDWLNSPHLDIDTYWKEPRRLEFHTGAAGMKLIDEVVKDTHQESILNKYMKDDQQWLDIQALKLGNTQNWTRADWVKYHAKFYDFYTKYQCTPSTLKEKLVEQCEASLLIEK